MNQFVVGALLLGALVASMWGFAAAARRILMPEARGASAQVATAVLALGTLIVLAEIMGTFGAFRRVPLAVTGTVLGALGWAALRHRVPDVDRADVAPTQPDRTAYWLGLGGCALAAARWGAWTALPLNLGITDYDSLNYHLTFAARFVQSGFTGPLHFVSPDSPVQLYPQNGELLHAVGMLMLGSDLLSVFINLGWLMFALLCGWAIGRRFALGPVIALALAAVLVVPVMVISEAGTAETDMPALALLLASLAIFVDVPVSAGSLFVGGLAAGLAVGTKLTVVAPCLLLGATVLVTAARRGSGRAGVAWLGGAAATGSYWYLRNLVITGSPYPALRLGIGPLAFPHATFRVLTLYGFSVAHYLGRLHIWRTTLIPDLKALGYAWPALLLVTAAAAVFALWRRSGFLRALGLMVIVSGAVYVVTPTTALGFSDVPLLFAQNLRYLVPTLAVGMILAVLVTAERGERWRIGAGGLAALILAVTLIFSSRDWPSWPSAYPVTAVALAVASAAVVLVCAGASLVRLRLGWWGKVLGSVALAGLAVAVGSDLNTHFERSRYSEYGLDRWVDSHLRHARIAIAGFDTQYPLYGSNWSNYVQYVGTLEPHGGFTVSRSCRAWRRNLARGRFDYVVIQRELLLDYPVAVPELSWTTTDPGARKVFESGGATVVRLTRPPDASLCPPHSVALPPEPSSSRGIGAPGL
jgi:hypothetical protein